MHRLGKVELCICISADSEVAQIVASAVEEVAREMPPVRRKLTFRSRRPDAIRSMQLKFSPVAAELRKFCMVIEHQTLILEFTAAGVEEIVTALREWSQGAEDFCLYPRGKKGELGEKDKTSGELWFWSTMLP